MASKVAGNITVGAPRVSYSCLDPYVGGLSHDIQIPPQRRLGPAFQSPNRMLANEICVGMPSRDREVRSLGAGLRSSHRKAAEAIE